MSEADSQGPPNPSYFQLFLEIGIIDQLARTAFEKQLPHGLTVAQFSLLSHLVRMGDGKTPAELASAFQVTRGTMTSTLKRLDAKGFILVSAHQTDGRSKLVHITDEGRQAHSDSLGKIGPELKRVEAAVPGEAIARVLPVLQSLRKWMDDDRN